VSARKTYAVTFLNGWFVLVFIIIWVVLAWQGLAKESRWFSVPIVLLITATIVACIIRLRWRLELTDMDISFKGFREKWTLNWQQVTGWCCIENTDGDIWIYLKTTSQQTRLIHSDFLSNAKMLREISAIIEKHCSKPTAAKSLLTSNELPMFSSDKQI
jgi:hypothetical protein